MGRRRKVSINKRTNKRPVKKDYNIKKKRMLNMRYLRDFKFELKETLTDLEGENTMTIFANILSKSSNVGIDEAKEYITSAVENEELDKEKAKEVIGLLNKFSKFR